MASCSSHESPALKGLATLGTDSYVSQHGVESILKAVASNPELLHHGISRRSIKRARETATHVASDYGDLIRSVTVPYADKSEHAGDTYTLHYIHPVSMLVIACERLPAFRELITFQLLLNPSTQSQPWHYITYNDEVTPGNAVKGDNDRKTQAMYWSLRELGFSALGCEEVWFVLCVVRSHIVRELGGMSVLLKHLLLSFVHDTSNIEHGILLRTDERQRRLFFAKFGFLVADESALKHSLDVKGSSGIVCCPLCRFTVDDKQVKDTKTRERTRVKSFAHSDKTGALIPYTETDSRKFTPHTRDTIGGTVAMLIDAKRTKTTGQFDKLQTHIGFNCNEGGILFNDTLRNQLTHEKGMHIMYDAQHVWFVNGIFNKELGALLDKLKLEGIDMTTIHDYIARVRWPSAKQSGASDLLKLFKKPHKKGEQFSCTASEGLCVMKAIGVFLNDKILGDPAFSDDLKAAAMSFGLMRTSVDKVLTAATGRGDHNDVRNSIKAHHDLHQAIYGHDLWIFKFHQSAHFGDFYEYFRMLVTCWTLERKHKEPKRIANNYTNNSGAWETGLLEEIIRKQFAELSVRGRFSPGTAMLNANEASSDVARSVRAALGLTSGTVIAALEVCTHGLSVKRNDVVKYQSGSEQHVGDVCFHAQVNATTLTCLRPWKLLHVKGNRYKVGDEPRFVDTFSIIDTCAYFLDECGVAVVL
jgi:hypothetical protein